MFGVSVPSLDKMKCVYDYTFAGSWDFLFKTEVNLHYAYFNSVYFIYSFQKHLGTGKMKCVL